MTTANEIEAVGEIIADYDLASLRQAVAALHNRNKPVFVSIMNRDLAIYDRVENGPNEYFDEVERVESNYCEPNAKLSHSSVVALLNSPTGGLALRDFEVPRYPHAPELGFQKAVTSLPMETSLYAVKCLKKDIVGFRSNHASILQETRPEETLIRISISDALTAWVAENRDYGKESAWSAATAKENPAYVKLLVEVIGDKLICDVTIHDLK